MGDVEAVYGLVAAMKESDRLPVTVEYLNTESPLQCWGEDYIREQLQVLEDQEKVQVEDDTVVDAVVFWGDNLDG